MGLSAIYTGATGMKTHGKGMQVIGNNLANVGTVGFKNAMALYEDLRYSTEASARVNGAGRGEGTPVGLAQVGKGVALADVRTDYRQGAFELGTEVTDIAISGKGFFGVSKDGAMHYSRAGNFRFDLNGRLVDPHGFVLQGRPIVDGVESATSTDIQLLSDDNGLKTMPARATRALSLATNLGSTEDLSSDSANPYFSLLQAWNGQSDTPLSKNAFSYSEGITTYDSTGKKHELRVYFDRVTDNTDTGSRKVFEFIVTVPPEEDGRAGMGSSAGKGVLLSGTLTFSSAGELQNMSAFSLSGGDPALLSNWSPAMLGPTGLPQLDVAFAGAGAQTIALDLGISGDSATWAGGVPNAAAVGTKFSDLPSLSGVTKRPFSSTAFAGSSSTTLRKQDGYGEGVLQNIAIDREGVMSGAYSNGQSQDLYRIALYRFPSEHGLKHEGNNHFSATDASGAAQEGVPSTENFGKVASKHLEMSNVDMGTEFVHMITNQRGFQANSKIITTQDEMIKKALQVKR